MDAWPMAKTGDEAHAPDLTDGAELFRQAFRRHATTVVIVTYFDGTGRACGMTATSMCSLSASPPSLMVCINRASRAHAEITDAGAYGVNLLSVGQRSVALHCSRPGSDKRLRDDWLVPEWRRRRHPACAGRWPISNARWPHRTRCTRTRCSSA